MNTILVSNKHLKEKVFPVRTKAQRDTALEITQRPNFDFACGNPFKEEVGDYVGTFCFTFYTTDKRLHVVKITPTGRITKWGTI